MAARGTIAKNNVADIIASAFGNNFIKIDGGKIYVWADDGGTAVQIALTMTCPKAPSSAPVAETGTAASTIDKLMAQFSITED